MTASSDSSSGGSDSGGSERPLRSAYEAALERLESQGIAAPDASALSDSSREAVAEARRQAEAKRAELEILHQKQLGATRDPAERQRLEEEYVRERRAIDEKLQAEIERLRRTDSG